MSKRKVLRNIIVVLVLVVVAMGILLSNRERERQQLTELLNVKRVELGKKNLEQLVIASGKIESQTVRNALSTKSGKVIEVRVSENQQVQEDDVIAVVETTDRRGKKKAEEVKSSLSGNVSKVLYKIDQLVVEDQTPMIELVDLNNLKVIAALPEADINKLKVDQEARLTFTALPDVTTKAKVSFIGLTPISLAGQPTVYKVELTMLEIPNQLKIGMSADIEIVTAQKLNVLTVEDSYIFKKDNKDYVKIIESSGDKVSLRDAEISTGFVGENEVEILQGALEGEEVILPTEEIRLRRGEFSIFNFNQDN